jgi:hypothetical protein
MAKRVHPAWTGEARRRCWACDARWRELERRGLGAKREKTMCGNTWDGQQVHQGAFGRVALCNTTSSSAVSCCSGTSSAAAAVPSFFFRPPTSGPEKELQRASRTWRPKWRRGAEGNVGGKDPLRSALQLAHPQVARSPRLLTVLAPLLGLVGARSEAETQ